MLTREGECKKANGFRESGATRGQPCYRYLAEVMNWLNVSHQTTTVL
jgi:hypothetical protein